MDFERGAIDIAQPKRESGYSEAELAKDTEVKGFDYKNLKRARKQVNVSRKEKILKAYKLNSARIIQLVEELYQINGANLRQEENIVLEIKNLRQLQEELLNALILEQKNQLTKDTVSKQAWNLIE